jgi:hypothetical protein
MDRSHHKYLSQVGNLHVRTVEIMALFRAPTDGKRKQPFLPIQGPSRGMLFRRK